MRDVHFYADVLVPITLVSAVLALYILILVFEAPLNLMLVSLVLIALELLILSPVA